MSMKITKVSHTDHNLTVGQLDFIKQKFADRTAFFLETVELPEELGTVEIALVGPATGANPVAETDVRYVIRGGRKCATRALPGNTPKPVSRFVTVIAGPHEAEECVLYTAYGGPAAPREPGDPGLKTMAEIEEARVFWAQHALIVD